MKLPRLILAFIATICLIFAGNALAQTDININNTNLIRFGGDVTVPANQVVENAHAFGGNVTISPNARVLDNDGNRSILQQFSIGLAILTGLSLIPFLGGLVVFLVNLFGLGVILRWQFGRDNPQITA